MKIEKVNLGETGNFSPIFLDYIRDDKKIRPFYSLSPQISSFKEAISGRTFTAEKRALLSKTIRSQYAELPTKEAASKNISNLDDSKTFTITTGHQLNIFTGPLYFIYKIITVINICKRLNEEYPDNNFVPVYWMASEDHDFEEINHFNLFGKDHHWKTDQKGPVGRFSTSSIKDLIDRIPEKLTLFEEAYTKGKTLAAATRIFVHELFGDEGLVVVDGDSPDLKRSFSSIIKADLIQNKAHKLVEETSEALDEEGYKNQGFPREINFFYMEDGVRERITKVGDHYEVLNTDLRFTEAEILQLLETSPEKFSPNVIMRPLYQEVILPNLAYIGGPAEIAYWLQLKAVFKQFDLDFPILMPRNFAVIVPHNSVKKIEKLAIALEDLFLPLQELKQKYILQNSEHEIQLAEEKQILEKAFEMIASKAEETDKSLRGFVEAEATKTFKSLDNIIKKLQKAEEKNQEVSMSQIENLKEKLFPGEGLQERKENILSFSINNPGIIQFLLNNFDPFDYRFNFVLEND